MMTITPPNSSVHKLEQSLLAGLVGDDSPRAEQLRQILSAEISEEDILEIRKLIGRYFAQKLTEEMDKSMKARGITVEMLDKVSRGEMSLDELP